MIRTAIIGITGYGKEHLRLLERGCRLGRMSAQAAVVVNPEEAAEGVALLRRLGCRVYHSVDRMWAEENGNIELCLIPTPIATHHAFVRKAFAHGSHVLVEKPACPTVEQVRELADLADAVRLQGCVGFQDIYSPQVRFIQQRLVEGWVGRVTALRCWGSWPRALSYYRRNSWAGRLRDANGWVLDSPVNNAMAHFLNLMLFWAAPEPGGFAQPEWLEGELYRAQDIESFDTALLRLETREGVRIFFAVTHSGEANVQPVVRVEGEQGWLEWAHCGLIRYHGPRGSGSLPQPDLSLLRDGMMDDVCRRVTTGTGPVVTLRDCIPHTLCVNALHDASAIQDIPAECRAVSGKGADAFVQVPGLNGLLERACATATLLKEGPRPWPAPDGVRLRLAGYAAFRGGYACPAPSPAAPVA